MDSVLKKTADFIKPAHQADHVAEDMLPTVSAIVVTYHSGPRLKECIHALCANKEVTEIIIVNNGNDELMTEWLKRFNSAHRKCDVHLITSPGNIGMGAGVNLGVKQAKSECLLIINPDAVLKVGSIPALEVARRLGEGPCLVGGKIYYQNGEEQRGGRRELLTLPRAIVSFSGLSKFERLFPAFRNLHREKDPEPEGPVQMPVISGAFCYISREDFDLVEGFDERYFLHVEDIDLCRKIADHGGEVMYTPKAGALHYGSTSKVSASFVEWHKARGLSKYFEKYAKTPAGKLVARASLLIFATLLIGRSTVIRSYHNLRTIIRRLLMRR